jgi:hypothetical protein
MKRNVKNGLRLLTVVLGMGFGFSDVAEGDTPGWLAHPPKEDAAYRYYVGRSTPAESQAEAFKQSYQDAVENAVKENFGYTLQINKSSYEGVDKASLRQKVQEEFQKAEIHGFELQNQFIEERKDNTFEAFTLFRFSREEIRKEQTRLKETANAQPVKVMSELRGGRMDGGATLIVVTVPKNASIFVDGEAFGRSDARIRNLPLGEHKVKIESDNYELVEEVVHLTPGSEVTLQEHLQLSRGEIRINASLPNAIITVNGKLVGPAPTEFLKVNAGEEILIRAEHPEAETTLQSLTVSRNERREIELQLQPKPAFGIFKTVPGGADILANGKKVGTTNEFGQGKFPLPAGSVEISVEKPGFVSDSRSIELRGGQTKVVENIHLVSLAERDEKDRKELAESRKKEAERKEYEAREREEAASAENERISMRPWRILFGVGGGSNNISNLNSVDSYSCCMVADFTFERHFADTIILRMGYDYRGGVIASTASPNINSPAGTQKDYVVNSNANEFYAGLYGNLSQYFYVGPEAGRVSTSVSSDTYKFVASGSNLSSSRVTANKIGGSKTTVNQTFLGGRIGAESKLSDNGVGGYFETALRSYRDAGAFKGGTKFQITAGVVVGF